MSNLYVGMYRDVLKNFYEKQRIYNGEIEQNERRFSPEYAKQENEQVKSKQYAAYSEAKKSINEIFEDVKHSLSNACYLDAEALTADRMLLDDSNSFNLTAADVTAMIEKHVNNFTMLRLIQNWIDKHNEPEEGKMFGRFEGIKIPMPADQLDAYRKFAQSALSICDKIYQNQNVMRDPLEIQYYGDESMAGDLLSSIGSGMKLSEFKNKTVPASVAHTFDNVRLTLDSGNGNVFVG